MSLKVTLAKLVTLDSDQLYAEATTKILKPCPELKVQ